MLSIAHLELPNQTPKVSRELKGRAEDRYLDERASEQTLSDRQLKTTAELRLTEASLDQPIVDHSYIFKRSPRW